MLKRHPASRDCPKLDRGRFEAQARMSVAQVKKLLRSRFSAAGSREQAYDLLLEVASHEIILDDELTLRDIDDSFWQGPRVQYQHARAAWEPSQSQVGRTPIPDGGSHPWVVYYRRA